MIKGIHISIKGIVQGVAFRYHTQLKAQELNIRGIVKNETDGSVTIIAEAESESLMLFLEWCHNGPSSADVQEVSYEYVQPRSFRRFIIER